MGGGTVRGVTVRGGNVRGGSVQGEMSYTHTCMAMLLEIQARPRLKGRPHAALPDILDTYYAHIV